MSGEFPVSDGTTLTTAVFGVPVGGLVQVWTDRPTVWHLADAAAFSDAVGQGTVSRTQIRTGRYREACLFDENTGTLMLEQRGVAEQTDEGYRVGGRVFSAQAPSDVFGDPWDDLRDAIVRTAAKAFARGELIVVEPGGWDDADGRYVLIVAVNDDGVDRIVMETVPTPTGSESWPPADDDDSGQTVSAPATDEALRGAGSLAIDAINRWGVAPWDVTVTYVVPGEAFTDD